MIESKTKALKSIAIPFVSGVIVCLIMALTTMPIFANMAYGSVSTVDAPNGYKYSIVNYIDTYKYSGVNYAVAYTLIGEKNGKSIPSGYVGICPRLFNASTGNMVKEGPWTYNGSGSGANYVDFVAQINASGGRYSQGLHKTWTGAAYWTHDTFPSPASSLYN